MTTPETAIRSGQEPVTRSRLVADLHALGVRAGGVLMVHTRLSALGWVVGGSGTVVLALLDALRSDGTLMAYAGWEDDPFGIAAMPEAWRAAYEADLPAFDPATSEAVREHGRLPERIRTWPGAQRSRHPEANIVALGARAAWVTTDHPWDDPYGAESPLAKLVAADGQVLMVGAPLDTLTLLHHAEATAHVAHKRRVTYRMPIREHGRTVLRKFRDMDTSRGAFDYDRIATEIEAVPGLHPGEEAFAAIARLALAAGIGRSGTIGAGESFLFPAADLHQFAESWLERQFAADDMETAH
ncbi:MAG: aminoglycoside 3-N-acetyltransferase [Thermomicrobiales bacterium]